MQELAERLLNVFPRLDDRGRSIALAVYRELARGAPVEHEQLALRSGLPRQELDMALRAWPGVFFDDEQRIIGFWGLTIKPMPHRLRLAGRELYAWCAWDTLFLPGLIGGPARVESNCHATGQAIALTVNAHEAQADGPAPVLSFLIPDAAGVSTNVVSSFCHHVHFFVANSGSDDSVKAIQAWYAKTFGAKPGKRGQFEAADLPGVNLTFAKSDTPTAATKGRELDHIGFEIKDLKAFCKKAEAAGIKLDMPYTQRPEIGLALAFITDPWGTYIELNEGLDKL